MKDRAHIFFALMCALSGLGWLIGWTLNINRDSLLGAEIAFTGYALAPFALLGIFECQRHRSGPFLVLGFFVCLLANTLFIGWTFLDIARLSGVAPGVDWLQVQSQGPTRVVGVCGGLAWMIGLVCLGWGSLRAAVFSKVPCLMLGISGLLPLLPIAINKRLVRVAALAFLLLAIEIWRLPKKARTESAQAI
ncbi:MAG: hypothetical protein H6510_02425 [Acidobacteria bacterium]|nr:hypothetical protein [Acidobacteriota bacterium]MCB9396650.1 hypothetical protein [Acidobacteriota bacterium]